MTRSPSDPLALELEVWARGALLIGVDEVGRGPLAGPVVAAAVALRMGQELLQGVRDSKQVKSPRRREALAELIRGVAVIGVGAASVREIEQHNIRVATAIAMQRAILSCRRRLVDSWVTRSREFQHHQQPSPDSDQSGPVLSTEVVIDGLPLPELGQPHLALVRGDAICHTIAAASLVAKVIRDGLMRRLAERRPGYGWESNSGYGTAAHLAGLRKLGLTPHHRIGFCSSVVSQQSVFSI